MAPRSPGPPSRRPAAVAIGPVGPIERVEVVGDVDDLVLNTGEPLLEISEALEDQLGNLRSCQRPVGRRVW